MTTTHTILLSEHFNDAAGLLKQLAEASRINHILPMYVHGPKGEQLNRITMTEKRLTDGSTVIDVHLESAADALRYEDTLNQSQCRHALSRLPKTHLPFRYACLKCGKRLKIASGVITEAAR